MVGWDGLVYPFTFNADDFEPITGTIHQPPPIHQTFEATGFVVCTFAPRLLDTHPDAIKVPYAHCNVESDEVLYYVRGKFGSRRGVEEASFTLHPHGIPHGPHPGTIVASRDVTRTDELAVMVDTFRPLLLTQQAMELDDPKYPYSWLEWTPMLIDVASTANVVEVYQLLVGVVTPRPIAWVTTLSPAGRGEPRPVQLLQRLRGEPAGRRLLADAPPRRVEEGHAAEPRGDRRVRRQRRHRRRSPSR